MTNVRPTMSVTEARDGGSTSARRTGSELSTIVQVTLIVALSCALGYAIVDTPLALVDHFEKSTVLIAAGVCAAVIAFVWLRAVAPIAR